MLTHTINSIMIIWTYFAVNILSFNKVFPQNRKLIFLEGFISVSIASKKNSRTSNSLEQKAPKSSKQIWVQHKNMLMLTLTQTYTWGKTNHSKLRETMSYAWIWMHENGGKFIQQLYWIKQKRRYKI